MLKPRPNLGTASILVKWTKTAPNATVPFSLLLLDLNTGPEKRRIPKVSFMTENLQRLRMSLEHFNICSFFLCALRNPTRNLKRKRRSNIAKSRGKVETQRLRSQEAPQLPMAEAAKTWVTSPVLTVIRRVTTQINGLNPGKTMRTRKISCCLAYTGLEWQDARSVRRSRFGFFGILKLGFIYSPW